MRRRRIDSGDQVSSDRRGSVSHELVLTVTCRSDIFHSVDRGRTGGSSLVFSGGIGLSGYIGALISMIPIPLIPVKEVLNIGRRSRGGCG